MDVTKDYLMVVMTALELDHLMAVMKDSQMRIWLESLMGSLKAASLDHHLD